ncbi:MFS transporter [Anoxynatronum buryatiense]|uniref:Fucose permease n=1 Tax=Anoxynatronum buryatiense TaxID=489973 RepID=A0AA46AIU3_9CLOT|nr:MFS transporter [Anoxynatronum buryatiense]SMP54158.1 Fucose permease [Anoxynatronum buryatiense]
MSKPSFYTHLTSDEQYILKCCFFVFAVNGIYAVMLGSLLPLISSEYSLSNTISGSLLSAHQVGNLAAGFIAGILPVYLGRKKAILFLCSFVAVGFIIMMTTGNPVWLLLGFLFIGISRGSIANFNNTVVNEVSDSNPAALNLLHSIFAIGALTAPFIVILSMHLGGAGGWRIATGFVVFLVILAMGFFSRMNLDDTARKKRKVTSYEFMKNRNFQVGVGILFFYLCAEAAITGWLVKYFIDAGIMTTAYAQVLNALLWTVILAGRLTCTYIGSRIPKEKLLTAMGLGFALFYLLLLSTRQVTVITIAIMGLGFSMAGIYPTTVASVGGTLKEYPMAMGILLIISGIGSVMMPIITGALSDQFGIFIGMAAVVMAIALMMVSVAVNNHLWVKEKKGAIT